MSIQLGLIFSTRKTLLWRWSKMPSHVNSAPSSGVLWHFCPGLCCELQLMGASIGGSQGARSRARIFSNAELVGQARN